MDRRRFTKMFAGLIAAANLPQQLQAQSPLGKQAEFLKSLETKPWLLGYLGTQEKDLQAKLTVIFGRFPPNQKAIYFATAQHVTLLVRIVSRIGLMRLAWFNGSHSRTANSPIAAGWWIPSAMQSKPTRTKFDLLDVDPAALIIYHISANGVLEKTHIRPITATPMVHDFMITETKIVILVPPYRASSMDQNSFVELFEWKGQDLTQVLVIDKNELSDVTTIEMVATFCLAVFQLLTHMGCSPTPMPLASV